MLAAVTAVALCTYGCASGPRVERGPHLAGAIPDPPPPTRVTMPMNAAGTDRAGTINGSIADFLARTETYRSTPTRRDVTTPLDGRAQPPPPQPPGVGGPRAGRRAPRRDIARDTRTESFANTQVTLTTTNPPVPSPSPALPVVQAVSIGSPGRVDVPAPTPKRTSTTNEPIDARPTAAPYSLDDMLHSLAERAAASDEFGLHWQLRLMQLALHRADDTPETSTTLPDTDRRLLAAMTSAVSAARAAARDPMSVDQDLLDDAAQLQHVLSELADLVVSSVTLCRRVLTFGVYDEMGDEDFIAGRAIHTIVYCEVRNFASQETSDGRYRTRLATRLEVLTADGQSLWHREEPEIEDVCRNRRSDFFLAQRVTLPPTLPAGPYVLKVSVEDRLSGRLTEATHPFLIQSSLAASIAP
ncbi:MAG: hypothetical protein ACE5E6_10900 [Phycisphaerae bacterium]